MKIKRKTKETIIILIYGEVFFALPTRVYKLEILNDGRNLRQTEIRRIIYRVGVEVFFMRVSSSEGELSI